MSENTTRSRRPLLRDEDQKMIAGVCTGLGHHFDVDPVIFRILFAVLTFFGGLGVLAYAACWLVIPAQGGHDSEAHRLLTGPNVYVAAGAAALMVLGLLWFTDILANRFDQSLPLVLAGAAAIGVIVWRRENHAGPHAPDPHQANSTDNPIPGTLFDQAPTWWQRPVPDRPQPPTENPGHHATPDSAHITPDKADPDIAIPEPLEPADRIDQTTPTATSATSNAAADTDANASANTDTDTYKSTATKEDGQTL